MSDVTEDDISRDWFMKHVVEPKQQAVNDFVQAEVQRMLQPWILSLLREPVDGAGWRNRRRLRRFIRHDILRATRKRYREAKS